MDLTDRIRAWGSAAFALPAWEELLLWCEAELGHPLPAALRAILTVSDEITGEGWLGLVWSADLIARLNRERRMDPVMASSYMSFDSMVFFADAGNGDEFAVSLAGSHDAFAWDHEDDSRRRFASTVLGYLEEWMTGRRSI